MLLLPCLITIISSLPYARSNSFSKYMDTETNEVAPRDKMSHYRALVAGNTDTTVEVEEKKTIKISSQIEIPDSEGLRLVLEALKITWGAAWKGVLEGFLPTVERVRRETRDDWEKNFLLDWAMDMCGAVIGRQKCSQKVACRAGKLMQAKVPGAQMMVVMAESFVPPGFLDWFGVIRQSVVNRRDSCVDDYQCDFSEM
eukprot:GFUD01022198.1.p1 GENE.GFUD01022198.1~~GFUD01022198.1.p1  ORF type:complete len:199 (+),score=40.83 GFUD01022198.1:82-678(+)